VAWSLLLLFLLLYIFHLRRSMTNLYVRALCILGRSSMLDRLGATSRSRWGWLAPLPRTSGTPGVSADLRLGLGSHRFELPAYLGVIILVACLVTMQAVVVVVSSGAAPVLAGRKELLCVAAVVYSAATLNVLLAASWLWPWSRVPDYKPNEEGPWYYRRTVVLMLTFGLPGVLLSRGFVHSVLPKVVRKRPRFKKAKAARHIEAVKQLEVGFYRNTRSQVIHYVSFLAFPNNSPSRIRRKRRRVRLLRLERLARNVQRK